MIDINLIPMVLRKGGKTNTNAVAINIPKEILLGVGVGLIFILVMVHVILGAIWFVNNGHISSYNVRWDAVVPLKTQYDNLTRETGNLKKKISTLSDITTKKSVYWSPKFNIISDSLPKGLWIRRMTLDKAGLTIEGSAVSKNQNEINNVGVFMSNLKQSDIFMKDFASLEVNSIQENKDNSVEVKEFSILAKLK